MTDLIDMVEPFKRSVAVPGTFDATFPETTDTDIEGVLADSVAEAQLDGLLSDHALDLDASTVSPDLVPAQQALVLLYGWVRMLTNELISRKTHVRYEAGGAVFEEDQGASLLVDIHKEMKQRKKDIIEQAQLAGASSAFVMVDQSYVRSRADYDSTMLADIGFNLSVLAAL